MASLTRWTWVWVNSRSWWWTRRPGLLQFMGSQRVGHDWATELNWTDRCESWTIKRAERKRIDAFKLWSWRRLWRVPWTARKSKMSILKGISPEYSLEGLMLKLKLQYFGHLMQRTNSLEKTLILERLKAGEEGETEDEMVGWHHWLDGHYFE